MNQLVAELDEWFKENEVKLKGLWTENEVKSFISSLEVVQNGIEEIEKYNDHLADDLIHEYREV